MEGAGAVPRAALPRGGRRRAGQRAQRPPGRACRVHRRGGRRRPGRRARRHRHRPGGGRRAVPRGPSRPRPRRRAPGPRDRGGRAGTGVDRTRVVRSRVHPCRLPRLRRVLPLGGARRPALHQAVRGRRRLEPGDHCGRHGRLLHRAGRPDSRAGSRAVQRRPLPGARPARHRRPGRTPRDRRRGGRMDRRCAGERARRRPRADGARPGEGQPSDPRLHPVRHRQAAAVALVDPCAAPEPPSAVPLLTDRARPRPARPRRSPTSCTSCTRTWRSSGWPSTRHRGPGGRRRAGAPGVAGGWRANPRTSRASAASTTCTSSRRCAPWTRSSSRTSTCSTI